MSIQMFIGMVVQMPYFFTDLKFVSMLGNEEAAGFSAAGNLWFVVLALTQILNVGTAAMVSHAVGAQQHDRANLVFNQSLCCRCSWGSSCSRFCIRWRSRTCTWKRPTRWSRRPASTIYMGVTPGLGIQFVMISMFATLRGTGIVKPTMIIQFITVVVNITFRGGAHHRLAHGQAVSARSARGSPPRSRRSSA